jgi:YfiH family protein
LAVLQRRISESKLVWYESPLLAAAGVPHAFSTRLGGVSRPPFDSLNFGNPPGAVQDPAENLEANYARFLSAIGVPERKVLRVHQVHGGQIVTEPCDYAIKADGIIVTDALLLASVRTADCVPVLLATQDGRAAAAVHAGWRGVVAGVVHHAIAEMRKSNPGAAILAAIGPCISFDAFEVGPEVLDAFESILGKEAPIRRNQNAKGRVDLRAAIGLQLQRDGVSRRQIDISDRCTVRDRGEFFSHRRDQGITGRMVSLVGVR